MKTTSKPGVQYIRDLETEVTNGRVKVPRFQREYVWSLDKASRLLDSMLKGYPVGSLIYWNTTEDLREVRELGGFKFPESGVGKEKNYVLDGQQRLTSILAAIRGEVIELKEGGSIDFSDLRVCISDENSEQKLVVTKEEAEQIGGYTIPLAAMWSRRGKVYDKCPEMHRETRDAIVDTMRAFAIPITTMYEADLSTATEVFSRINTSGKDLTIFEIMVAKSYQVNPVFDLLDEWEEISEKLNAIEFDTLKPSDILQLVALVSEGDCRKSTILNMSRDKFIETWPLAVSAFESCLDFVRSRLKIPTSKLIPYPALVVAISYFFYLSRGRAPTAKQTKFLKDYFWRAAWSERYGASADSKLANDIVSMKKIFEGEVPEYDWVEEFSFEYVMEMEFSVTGALEKCILAVLASLGPRSFRDGAAINLQNNYMKQANSKNFHHVFPKAFLKKNGLEHIQNRIANISLVEDHLNKWEIRAKPPSEYFKKFADEVEDDHDFSEYLGTHLIKSNDDSPIWNDDYEQFLEDRSKLIISTLKKYTV